MNTKERIWKESLQLFSKYGYEGVSVKQIADAVDIKDSSLYNHYKSKQEIFDTILKEVSILMKEASNKYTFPQSDDVGKRYIKVDKTVLSDMCFNLFDFYLNDKIVSSFRRMLIIEQYTNSDASKLFHEIFIDGALKYEANVFKTLIENNSMKAIDSEILALQFYSPLFLLLFKFDSANCDKQYLRELIDKHVEIFSSNYAVESETK